MNVPGGAGNQPQIMRLMDVYSRWMDAWMDAYLVTNSTSAIMFERLEPTRAITVMADVLWMQKQRTSCKNGDSSLSHGKGKARREQSEETSRKDVKQGEKTCVTEELGQCPQWIPGFKVKITRMKTGVAEAVG